MCSTTSTAATVTLYKTAIKRTSTDTSLKIYFLQ